MRFNITVLGRRVKTLFVALLIIPQKNGVLDKRVADRNERRCDALECSVPLIDVGAASICRFLRRDAEGESTCCLGEEDGSPEGFECEFFICHLPSLVLPMCDDSIEGEALCLLP